jgi:hypothetical protein
VIKNHDRLAKWVHVAIARNGNLAKNIFLLLHFLSIQSARWLLSIFVQVGFTVPVCAGFHNGAMQAHLDIFDDRLLLFSFFSPRDSVLKRSLVVAV